MRGSNGCLEAWWFGDDAVALPGARTGPAVLPHRPMPAPVGRIHPVLVLQRKAPPELGLFKKVQLSSRPSRSERGSDP